jgi:hypothetical protein
MKQLQDSRRRVHGKQTRLWQEECRRNSKDKDDSPDVFGWVGERGRLRKTTERGRARASQQLQPRCSNRARRTYLVQLQGSIR